MNCPRCQRSQADHARSCPGCGLVFGVAGAPATPAAGSTAAAPKRIVVPPYKPPPPPLFTLKTAGLAVGGLVVLVILGYLVLAKVDAGKVWIRGEVFAVAIRQPDKVQWIAMPGAVPGRDAPPGALVGARVVLTDADGEHVEATTGATGLFTLHVSPGSYRIEVTADGYEAQSQTVEARAIEGQEAVELTFGLKKPS